MPNDVGVTRFRATFLDRSLEKSTTGFNVQQQADFAAYNTARGDWTTAVAAITAGTITDLEDSRPQRVSNTIPSIGFRESKFLIQYYDNTTLKRYTTTIPTAVAAVTFIPNTDFVDLTDPDVAAFVGAHEAFAASPEGNAITVLNIQFVGRNL